MKSTHDNAIDPLGSLGSPSRPAAPAAPDPVREFEHINDASKAIESIAETLRKKSGVTVEQGQAEDWEGMCIDPYTAAILGCI